MGPATSGIAIATTTAMSSRKTVDRLEKPYRILVVDDDADSRHLLGDLLQRRGYHVLFACDGVDGLRLLGSGEVPDLILFDLQMPMMDGYQLRDQLARHEAWSRVPQVLVTSVRDLDRVRLGPIAVLRKPLRLHQLLTLLAHHA